jgi:hypothetical protein
VVGTTYQRDKKGEEKGDLAREGEIFLGFTSNNGLVF